MSYSHNFKSIRIALSKLHGYKRFPKNINSMSELIKRYNQITKVPPNKVLPHAFPLDALKSFKAKVD
jgi:hypothetical protein